MENQKNSNEEEQKVTQQVRKLKTYFLTKNKPKQEAGEGPKVKHSNLHAPVWFMTLLSLIGVICPKDGKADANGNGVGRPVGGIHCEVKNDLPQTVQKFYNRMKVKIKRMKGSTEEGITDRDRDPKINSPLTPGSSAYTESLVMDKVQQSDENVQNQTTGTTSTRQLTSSSQTTGPRQLTRSTQATGIRQISDTRPTTGIRQITRSTQATGIRLITGTSQATGTPDRHAITQDSFNSRIICFLEKLTEEQQKMMSGGYIDPIAGRMSERMQFVLQAVLEVIVPAVDRFVKMHGPVPPVSTKRSSDVNVCKTGKSKCDDLRSSLPGTPIPNEGPDERDFPIVRSSVIDMENSSTSSKVPLNNSSQTITAIVDTVMMVYQRVENDQMDLATPSISLHNSSRELTDKVYELIQSHITPLEGFVPARKAVSDSTLLKLNTGLETSQQPWQIELVNSFIRESVRRLLLDPIFWLSPPCQGSDIRQTVASDASLKTSSARPSLTKISPDNAGGNEKTNPVRLCLVEEEKRSLFCFQFPLFKSKHSKKVHFALTPSQNWTPGVSKLATVKNENTGQTKNATLIKKSRKRFFPGAFSNVRHALSSVFTSCFNSGTA